MGLTPFKISRYLGGGSSAESRVRKYYKRVVTKIRRAQEKKDPENAPTKTRYWRWTD